MRKFNISFEVTAPKLTTVISLLTDEVGDLNIKEIKSADPITRERKSGYPAPRTQRVVEALKTVLADGKVHRIEDFHPALTAAGLSITSASPGLAKVKGLVRVGKGEYQLKTKANGHAS